MVSTLAVNGFFTSMETSSFSLLDASAGARYQPPVEPNLRYRTMNRTTENATGPWPASHGSADHIDGCLLFDFVMEAILMGIFCVLGFTGNTLSMLCLARDKSKTATPFLLMALAIADTMFLATVIPLRVLTSIYTYSGYLRQLLSVFPYFAVYGWGVAMITSMGTTWLTILVTVNRYVSVCRPYEASSLCSVRHAKKHIIIISAFCLFFNLPRFFEYEVLSVNDKYNRTHAIAILTKHGSNKIYQIIYANALYFLVMFLVPLVTLVILNHKLITALRKTKKKRAQLLNIQEAHHSKSEDDITLMLIVVVLVFVICQTPALVTQSLMSFLDGPKKECPSVFFYYERVSDFLVVLNSSLNFLIYCFCSRKFRQILIQLLCQKSMGSPESSVANHTVATRQIKLSRASRDSMV